MKSTASPCNQEEIEWTSRVLFPLKRVDKQSKVDT